MEQMLFYLQCFPHSHTSYLSIFNTTYKKSNILRPLKSKMTINAFINTGYTCLHLHTLYTLKYIKFKVLGTFCTVYYGVIFNHNNCYQKQLLSSNWHQ